MSNQEICISAHTNEEEIVSIDVPTGIADQDIQLIVSFKTVKLSTKFPNMRVPGIDEGHFVVPDDFDNPLPPELLKAFEGRD